MVFSYAGTGRIPQFTAVRALGLISYSYSSAVGEEFLYLDFGNVGLDYWVLENYQNTVLSSIQNEQLINLTETGGIVATLDYGSITQIEAVSTEDWGLITVSSNITSYGFLHFQSLTTWSVVNTWVGTGTVWEMDGGTRYRLNAPWIGSGTLRISGNTITNYVPNITTKGILPLRSDTNVAFSPNWNSFGTIFARGINSESITKVYNQSSDFNINGTASIIVSLRHIGSGTLFSLSNNITTRAYNYVGEGSLFAISGTTENVTYDYNPDSIVYFEYQDFGSVADLPIDSIVLQSIANDPLSTYANTRIIDLIVPGSTSGDFIDYGDLLIDGQDPPETLQTDWGYIWETYTKYPMGLGRLGGTASETYTPNYVGSGGLFAFINGIGRTKPRWIAYVNIGIFGEAITNFSLLHVGSGALFSLSNAQDSVTHSYLGSGDLYAVTGAAESVGFNPSDITTDIFIGGYAHIAFSPNWIAEGTITIDGASVERNTESYYGSGVLFGFDNKIERRTYSYNSSSNVIFTPLDYGSVADSPIDSIVLQTIANDPLTLYENDRIIDLVVSGSISGAFYDYGSIITDGKDQPETISDDYEYITETISRYAFGDLLFNGTVSVRREFNYVGSGDIKLWINGIGRTKPRWIAEVQLEVFGASVFRASVSESGSGSLFSFVSTEKRRSFAYEASGSLYAFNGAAESVGFNPADITTNIKFNGSAAVAYVPNWNGSGLLSIDVDHVVRTTFSESGFGNLFNIGDKVERRTYSYNSVYPTSDVRFSYLNYGLVSDSVIDSFVLQDIASDPLSLYENDRIIDLVYTSTGGSPVFDYGSVADPNPSITDDYEFIWQTAGRFAMGDFKFIGSAKTNFAITNAGSGQILIDINTKVQINPRWTANIFIDVTGEAVERSSKFFKGSGLLPTIINTSDSRSFAYEASGNLFAIAGASEAIGFNYPKSDFDIKLTGFASVAYVPNWNGSGTSIFSGESVERVAFDYVGKGILYNFETLIERRVYHYNTTSIDEYVHLDYGLVSSPAIDSWIIDNHSTVVLQTIANTKIIDLTESGSSGNYFDYGYLEQPLDAGLFGVQDAPDVTDDYQYILDSATIYPFGRLQLGLASFDTKTNFSLLHIGNEEGAQIKIGGEVSVRLPNVHAGSGTLFAISGASESATFSPDDLTGLFNFVGFAATRRIPNFNGGGQITLDGTAYSTVTFAGFQENTIKIRGIVQEVFTSTFAGSGSLYAFSGAAESVGFNPADITTDIKFAGTLSEKITSAYRGSGDLFAIGGLVESTTTAEDKRILISISGTVSERFIPNFNGSGSISVLSGAAESRTASPDDLTGLFNFVGFGKVKYAAAYSGSALLKLSGTTEPEILAFAEYPVVQVSISGVAAESFTPRYIGDVRIGTFSGAAESVTFNPLERDMLFSITGRATESFSFGAYEADADIKVYGQLAKTPNLTFAEQPTVQASIFGEAYVVNIDVYLAEGTIFSRGLVSESKTVKLPPIVPADIRLSGTATEAVSFNPPDITTEIKISGTGVVPILTFAEQPTVRVAISGVAIEKNTEAYLGTGTIFSNGIGGESVARKLPAFTADLNIIGRATESAAFREVFFGSLFTFRGSASPALLTFAEQPQTLGRISGVANVTRARDFVGSGRIATLSGAAEAVTFNPTEEQILFSATGVARTKYSRTWIGSGNISIYPEAADIRFTPNWNAEGTLPVRGIAEYRIAKDFVGDIRIGTFSGAAESVTFNPLEEQILFSFTGRASIRSAVSEVKQVNLAVFAEPVIVHTVKVAPAGTGSAQLFGEAVERYASSYVGDIRIGTFSGAAEAVTFNPLEEQILFSATGFAAASLTRIYIGTGNLYAFSGAAESTGVVTESTGLYQLLGEARIVTRRIFIGAGNLFNFASAQEKVSYDYSGEQILFALSGQAKESITSVEIGSGSIFSFSGAAERVAYSPNLQADIIFSGVAATPRARNFVGSGTLPVFGGAAEARTITYENVAIFDFLGQVKLTTSKAYAASGEINISGTAEVSLTRAPYSGSGEILISGQAEESITVNPPDITTEVKLSGQVSVLRTQAFSGSGTVKISGKAIIGIRIRIIGTGSIKINVQSGYTPLLSHIPDVHILFAGQARSVKIDVAPQRTYGWII